MPIPTKITFHEIHHSDAIEAAIQRWVARLEHVSDRIVRCEVRIEQPHRSHRQGREFEVHVVLGIPGNDVASSRTRHEDPYVAVADAFRATRRQLLDEMDTRREFVKAPGTVRQVTNLS
jgi:ribosome-associated translation inhibitor RaiA